MAERITAEQAAGYWADKSQQPYGLGGFVPIGDAFHYWAEWPVCAMFHPGFWPGLWHAHYGVDPAGWGRTVPAALSCLEGFWKHTLPSVIIGMTPAKNRQAVSFARRLGFKEIGTIPMHSGDVMLTYWRPEWA